MQGVKGLYCAWGGIRTGDSVILTVFAWGGVELDLFPWPACSCVAGSLVADCVDVGLGGCVGS